MQQDQSFASNQQQWMQSGLENFHRADNSPISPCAFLLNADSRMNSLNQQSSESYQGWNVGVQNQDDMRGNTLNPAGPLSDTGANDSAYRDTGVEYQNYSEYGYEAPLTEEKSTKQRMKWTPNVNSIFLNAIIRLGGADKATPKAILDIMKVEDVTVLQVKSHLQKFRLANKIQSVNSAARSKGLTKQNQLNEGQELNSQLELTPFSQSTPPAPSASSGPSHFPFSAPISHSTKLEKEGRRGDSGRQELSLIPGGQSKLSKKEIVKRIGQAKQEQSRLQEILERGNERIQAITEKSGTHVNFLLDKMSQPGYKPNSFDYIMCKLQCEEIDLTQLFPQHYPPGHSFGKDFDFGQSLGSSSQPETDLHSLLHPSLASGQPSHSCNHQPLSDNMQGHQNFYPHRPDQQAQNDANPIPNYDAPKQAESMPPAGSKRQFDDSHPHGAPYPHYFHPYYPPYPPYMAMPPCYPPHMMQGGPAPFRGPDNMHPGPQAGPPFAWPPPGGHQGPVPSQSGMSGSAQSGSQVPDSQGEQQADTAKRNKMVDLQPGAPVMQSPHVRPPLHPYYPPYWMPYGAHPVQCPHGTHHQPGSQCPQHGLHQQQFHGGGAPDAGQHHSPVLVSAIEKRPEEKGKLYKMQAVSLIGQLAVAACPTATADTSANKAQDRSQAQNMSGTVHGGAQAPVQDEKPGVNSLQSGGQFQSSSPNYGQFQNSQTAMQSQQNVGHDHDLLQNQAHVAYQGQGQGQNCDQNQGRSGVANVLQNQELVQLDGERGQGNSHDPAQNDYLQSNEDWVQNNNMDHHPISEDVDIFTSHYWDNNDEAFDLHKL